MNTANTVSETHLALDYKLKTISTFGDAETRGCVFPWCSHGKKKKELDFSNSLILNALQDGLELEKMKSCVIFRNHRKLKYNKLYNFYLVFSIVKISSDNKNWVQIGCNF